MIDTMILGEFGEFLVAKRLESKGHGIIKARYKKWEGEIDIISTKGGTIYFNEVKTRIVKKTKDVDLQNIGLTRHKMSKIIKCAQHFTQTEASYTMKQFDAYYLQAIPDSHLGDVSTLEDVKQLFVDGKIRILATIMENIDREVFGCYGNTLITNED